MARPAVWILASALALGCSKHEPVDGRWVADAESSLVLTLAEHDGQITGTLAEPGAAMPLVAMRDGDAFTGVIGPAGQGIPLRGTVAHDAVLVSLGAPDEEQTIAFHRGGAELANAPPAPAPPSAARHVVINEQPLSAEELAQIESAYQIRIPDAEYWYDATLGAWGPKGGPTMGFIAAGLPLGGALRADASGGGTDVFVNGRELHVNDVLGLQRITGPIAPGRYFITSDGLAGVEGGPPQWNLGALASGAAPGAASDDPTNSWQSSVTGASGFSDGETGAVFLPNGGIVSYGN